MPWYETRTRLTHATRTWVRGRVGLTPLIVAATGRSGTTLLMKTLGTSDLVVFDRIYAYEHAYVSYFLTWARLPLDGTPTAPNWKRASIDHYDILERHGVMGALPWKPRPLLESDDEGAKWARDAFRSIWATFSNRAVASQLLHSGTGRRPLYYAETAPLWVLDSLARIQPTRGIHLIRDPRDQWVSIMAFIEAKGNLSFGVRPDDTPETFARSFIERQRKYLERAHATTLAPKRDRLVLRYEDLVLDTDSQLTRLSAWLGVQLRRPGSATQKHSTSGSSRRSVGRWQNEMPTEVANMFKSELGSILDELHYS